MTKIKGNDNSNFYSFKNTVKLTLIFIVISFTLLMTVFWIIDYSGVLDGMNSTEQKREINERISLFFSDPIKGVEKDLENLGYKNNWTK